MAGTYRKLPGMAKVGHIVMLVLPLLFICILPSMVIGAQEPIRVGTTVSFTGTYAAPAQQQFSGIEMWVSDINSRGALLGRKVALVYYDDSSDPQKTAQLYRQLITNDKVDLLIGPYSSSLTMEASRIAEEFNFPMIAAGAASGKIWSRGFKNIFQIDAPATEYMSLVMQSAKEAGGLSRIAVVYPENEFSSEVAEGAKTKAVQYGMEIVYSGTYDLNNPGFSAMIPHIEAANPEVVLGATYLDDSIAFVREAKKQGFSPKAFAFTVGPALPEFGEALGADAEGIMGVVPWMHSGNLPMASDFSYRFRQKHGRHAGAAAAAGYSAGQVLEAGVRLAGSLDKDMIRQQFSSMRFRSLLGRYGVDETGKQISKSTYVIQWQKGKRELVLPLAIREKPIVFPFIPWSQR